MRLAATSCGYSECVKDGETGYLVEEKIAALADHFYASSDPDATCAMEYGTRILLSDFNLINQSKALNP